MGHVTHMIVLCKWVMSHTWLRYINGLCHICDTCKALLQALEKRGMDESCHTCGWVMSHIWMSLVTHVNKACLTYEYGVLHMSYMCMNHVTPVNGIGYTHTVCVCVWEIGYTLTVCACVCVCVCVCVIVCVGVCVREHSHTLYRYERVHTPTHDWHTCR